MADTKALLLVTMEPPAGLEEEFNDWYDTEHFPQRCALPGFETGARFVCIDGWPRWLALYDLSSPDALETPEYRAVSGTNSTPWSRRILTRCSGRLRVVAAQIAPGNALILSRPGPSRLVLGRFPALAPQRHATLAEAVREAVAKVDGVLQLRLFANPASSGRDLWAAVELGLPDATPALSAALTRWDDAAPDFFNVYSPYWRN